MTRKNTNVKYAPSAGIDMPGRQWPGRTLTRAPQWCSVDLRDGNQALPDPLDPEQKLEYFRLLCRVGFKNIEVSFPSASQDDFDFTRRLIEQSLIPDDVFIMTLTQAREHLIARTFESLVGVKRAIFHVYCATSDLHMDQVFGLSREQTLDMCVRSIKQVRTLADAMPDSDIRVEFSPEEFTDTDPGFAMEICQGVFEAWGKASVDKPVILNLPATVERRPPNQYADLIEWFCGRFPHRDKVSISLHAHNDQGMAVAATELALLAGADRVEGTLFGHGERTGNVDIVTLANNLRSRGVAPELDFSDLDGIVADVERLTGMPVPGRQPYAGRYVFTAFSGSHQDAIRKGLRRREKSPDGATAAWKVPYLHVDPADIGRRYEGLIRINSQSGKGGVAWVLERDYGIEPPKEMLADIGHAVQAYSDHVGREVTSSEVYKVFLDEFVNPAGPYELIGYWPRPDDADPTHIHGEVRLAVGEQSHTVTADGNGPISAFVHGVKQLVNVEFRVKDYHEQAVGKGADARALAFVPLELPGGKVVFGVGSDTNIDQAAVRAIVAALNRWATSGKTR